MLWNCPVDRFVEILQKIYQHMCDMFEYWVYSYDDSRTRNLAFPSRVTEKPIKVGTGTFKCNDRGGLYYKFFWDSICYAGIRTFQRREKFTSKYSNFSAKTCQEGIQSLVILDFGSPKILAWAKSEYGLRMIFIFSNHSRLKKQLFLILTICICILRELSLHTKNHESERVWRNSSCTTQWIFVFCLLSIL